MSETPKTDTKEIPKKKKLGVGAIISLIFFTVVGLLVMLGFMTS